MPARSPWVWASGSASPPHCFDALCERVRAAGPEVVYRTIGEPDALDPGVQLAVYGSSRSRFTNTFRHPGTDTRAQLTVSAEGAEVLVRVEGTGPSSGRPQTAHHLPAGLGGQGHGIAGMRGRAALYGGTVSRRRRALSPIPTSAMPRTTSSVS